MSRPKRRSDRVTTSNGGAFASAAFVVLCATLAASGLLVDPSAEAAFDAPKRLAASSGIALALALSILSNAFTELPEIWRRAKPVWRVAAVAALAAILVFVAAAILSPRRDASVEAMRIALLFATLPVLGASSLLEGGGVRALLRVFALVAAASSALSLLQRVGMQPFAIERISGRTASFGFMGNEGLLAIIGAAAVVVSAWLAIAAPSRAARNWWIALAMMNLAAALTNASVTALTALVAGAGVLTLIALPARRLLAVLGTAVVLAAVAAVAVSPLRARAREMTEAARAGDFDRITTYRTIPWLAALEMVRERPLLGFGPGTFDVEFVPHRLAAEVRQARRLVNPHSLVSGYGEAHCDPLHAAAEAGVPAATLLYGVFVGLTFSVARRARRESVRTDEAVIAAILVTIGVSSLTWFVMLRPLTAMLALLCLGRAWRLVATNPEEGRLA